MFRAVLPPIIRSAYDCIHSIWYFLHRYCYLPLSWKSLRPRLETRPTPHSYGNQRLQLQFERAPDDGQDNARNTLSSVYATKQYILRLIFASGWVFYLNINSVQLLIRVLFRYLDRLHTLREGHATD
jgi:hypothetical protein